LMMMKTVSCWQMVISSAGKDQIVEIASTA
jgi:hypothetical protein